MLFASLQPVTTFHQVPSSTIEEVPAAHELTTQLASTQLASAQLPSAQEPSTRLPALTQPTTHAACINADIGT